MCLCKINEPRGRAIFDPSAMICILLLKPTRWRYLPNIKVLGFLVSDEKISKCFPYMSLCKTNEPRDRAILTPGLYFEQSWVIRWNHIT